MKQLILSAGLFLLLLTPKIYSQSLSVNTDGSTANASAMLDVKSTEKGVLIPRMTSAQRLAIATPATGLQVYDTDLNLIYFYNGATWAGLSASTNFWTLSGGNIYNNTGTNVGIGTITPSAKLHVGAGTRFTLADVGSIFLQSGSGVGSARDWKIYVPMPQGYLSFRDMGFDNMNNGMATDAMVIQYNTGNVGIGTSTPSSKLEINGYTKLGSGGNVPAVQMKKLTGTSPSSVGAIVLIAHGLDWTKILAVDVLLDPGASSSIPPRYDNPVSDYSFRVTSTDIEIYNGASATAILSKPVMILITYEQ